MSILKRWFKKLFDGNNLKKENNTPDEDNEQEWKTLKTSLYNPSERKIKFTISPGPVGTYTGSKANDFYVYEWFIKDTGEVFYVGKGRGNRYKEFHDKAYMAEKIRRTYDTGYRFVKTGLTEEEAIELETDVMIKILNETNHRLTNRMTPIGTKRGNGYEPSPNTPPLKFETAPHLYASEIEEHYFGIKSRPFDPVEYENLKAVYFITRNIRKEIDIIYGGNLEKYLSETKKRLLANGNKILKSKYAKSVTAWVYIGDDYVVNYESDQKDALKKLRRNIPTYHLIDVWRLLKEKIGDIDIKEEQEVSINPVHNRVPLEKIRNLNDWSKGFDEGYPFWEEGEKERKNGNIEKAIELFDKARCNGYNAPVLYESYAKAYRKLKDYDNEIAILNEAIERLQSEKKTNNEITIINFKERKERAIGLKLKSSN